MFSTNVNTLKLTDVDYPEPLKNILYPPKQLYFIGAHPKEWLLRPKVTIVGSRKMSPYGKQITQKLTKELTDYGVVIISGLAYGVDVTAHLATIENCGTTVAVLATSLIKIYPSSHLNVARQIVDTGGTLLTEADENTDIYRSSFVARNRIVSGLADILLITEATIKSGSLHTARFALDQGKTVMAVPGNITSPGSEGCNNLIKSGAIPVTDVEDILFALNIKPVGHAKTTQYRGSQTEDVILKLIADGIQSQEELALAAKLESSKIVSALTMLEIAGAIRPQGNGYWTIA